MGYKGSKFACQYDDDCSKNSVCYNRKCTKPWLMGPCKMPKEGEKDPCPDYCHCSGNRCAPKPFKITPKCLAMDFECPYDHWCDVVNEACVPKPDLFEFCELDIGCRRPYICSKYSKKCIPPCSTTEECVSRYEKQANHPLVCHVPKGGDLEKHGYCEDSREDLKDKSSMSFIYDTVSKMVKSVVGEDNQDTEDDEVVIDKSIGSTVHPVISIGGESNLPSGFNLFLIFAAFGLLYYFYYYFVRLRKHASFYGGAFRPSRLNRGASGGNGQRDYLVSKLSNSSHEDPIVDISKDSQNSVHERKSLLSNPPPEYTPSALSENGKHSSY